MHDWYQQNTDAPNWRKMSWKENETVYINSYSKIKKVMSNTSSANACRLNASSFSLLKPKLAHP